MEMFEAEFLCLEQLDLLVSVQLLQILQCARPDVRVIDSSSRANLQGKASDELWFDTRMQ